MKQAPNDERPGRAVPETTEKHYYDEIRRAADRTDLIAAEWNVKVVPQKCRKGDVPPPPEIGKANGRVRKTEIILQMKAKAESRANGAGRIARRNRKIFGRRMP